MSTLVLFTKTILTIALATIALSIFAGEDFSQIGTIRVTANITVIAVSALFMWG